MGSQNILTERSEREIRKDIVEVCRRMHERGFISSGEGNVSVKLSERRILVTPSGLNKGFIKDADLVTADFKGRKISGKHKPTSEVFMHIAVYEERQDVGAVIHAHPPMTVAFSLAGVPLAQCLLPELIFTLGSVPFAGYATPTTLEVAETVRIPIRQYDAVVLDRHGTVTVGKAVFEAYDKLEAVEHTARITHYARQLGPLKPLPKEEVDKILKMGQEMGLRRAVDACVECGACGRIESSHANRD